MKKYIIAFIIGVTFLLLGTVISLLEIINYSTGIDYDKNTIIKVNTYNLDDSYSIYNNGTTDNINIIYNEKLDNVMKVEVNYNESIIDLITYTSERNESKLVNIYAKYKSNSNLIQHFYELVKDSISDKVIYDYDDSHKVKLSIHINPDDIDKITNYTSIINNDN